MSDTGGPLADGDVDTIVNCMEKVLTPALAAARKVCASFAHWRQPALFES